MGEHKIGEKGREEAARLEFPQGLLQAIALAVRDECQAADLFKTTPQLEPPVIIAYALAAAAGCVGGSYAPILQLNEFLAYLQDMLQDAGRNAMAQRTAVVPTPEGGPN